MNYIENCELYIRETANRINQYLFDYVKLNNDERNNLIAGCLIALSDEDFKNSYRHQKNNNSIINNFYSAIENSLKAFEGLTEANKVTILANYNFIKTKSTLIEERFDEKGNSFSILKNIIQDIEDYVYNLALNNPGFDALGIFYNEFTKYGGGDTKSLGIVLTPSHIADFMAHLLNIQETDRVLDLCCGTSSLLLAAATRSTEKPEMAIGVELQTNMMGMTIANMIIHKQSNKLFLGDSLSQEIQDKINTLNPTKGILNPPYGQSDISTDQFVLTMLNNLIPGGLCTVIMPIGDIIAKEKENFRRELLNNHNVKAIFKMPPNLFYPVNTLTQILLIEAKTPYSGSTFICNFEDDGYQVVKNKQRQDIYKIGKEKIQNIYNLYYDKLDSEISINAKLDLNTDWIVTAYLNNKAYKVDDFKKTIRDYILFGQGQISDFKKETQAVLDYALDICDANPNLKLAKNDINYDISKFNFNKFKISDLFDLHNGQGGTIKNAQLNSGTTPFVSSGGGNNGISLFTGLTPQEEAYTLTMANNGTVGACFVQTTPYSATSDATILKLKNKELSIQIGLYLATIIRKYVQSEYDWGRKCGLERLKPIMIELPTKEDQTPDWELMENYINSLPYSKYL